MRYGLFRSVYSQTFLGRGVVLQFWETENKKTVALQVDLLEKEIRNISVAAAHKNFGSHSNKNNGDLIFSTSYPLSFSGYDMQIDSE